MSSFVFNPKARKLSVWLRIVSILVMSAGQVGAYAVMTNRFTVKVSDMSFANKNGLRVRGKLFRLVTATADHPVRSRAPVEIKSFLVLAGTLASTYVCDRKSFRTAFLITAGLTLLFLPPILVIFGLHVYVMPIDRVFPMMMVNGEVFWFLLINIIGFLIFPGWHEKRRKVDPAVNAQELGISEAEDKLKLNWLRVWRSLLLAAVLFAFVYVLEAVHEALMLVDWRYKFPYASDLTDYRFLMLLHYFPLFLVGFIQVNILLQAQLRPAKGILRSKRSCASLWWVTWQWSSRCCS